MVKGSTPPKLPNVDSVWYGGPQERINPAARVNLDNVRKLLDENRTKEAEALITQTFASLAPSLRHYEPLGDVFLQFGHGTDNFDAGLHYSGIRNVSLHMYKEV